MNYASIAFSDAAKRLQERAGSRSSYSRMEQYAHDDVLTENELEFISQRDSFYLSTVSEKGFPYIQHKGGPKGFVRIIDGTTLGFVDFVGNQQFISVGNIFTNSKAGLFFIDYAAQTRLKIFAEAEVLELKDNPNLLTRLSPADYKFKPDRIMILHVKAFNWNCPQHIIPRYTLKEIEEAYSPQQEYIAKLESELKALKAAKA